MGTTTKYNALNGNMDIGPSLKVIAGPINEVAISKYSSSSCNFSFPLAIFKIFTVRRKAGILITMAPKATLSFKPVSTGTIVMLINIAAIKEISICI